MDYLIKIPEIQRENYPRCFALSFADITLFLQKVKKILEIKEGEEFTITEDNLKTIEEALKAEAETSRHNYSYFSGLPSKKEEFNENP